MRLSTSSHSAHVLKRDNHFDGYISCSAVDGSIRKTTRFVLCEVLILKHLTRSLVAHSVAIIFCSVLSATFLTKAFPIKAQAMRSFPAFLARFNRALEREHARAAIGLKRLLAFHTNDFGANQIVTPRDVSQKRLRKNEALLAAAEKIGRLGCWEHDLLTGKNIWSENLCQMLEIDPTKTHVSEELFWELLHPEDREKVRAVIEFGMKDAQEYEYRSRFIFPDAREKVFHTHGSPILNADNQVIKRIGVTQDITTQVEGERALMESEQRYRDIVESSNDLMCTHDLSGRVLWMNERPAKLLGYGTKELIGQSIPDRLNVQAEFAEYIKRIKKDGFANGLMALVTRSGERRIWEYRNTLRTDGAEPLVRGMARDVTEQMKAQKELEASRARLKAVLDSIDEIAFEFDADGTFLEVWTANESLLFRPRAELIGRRLADVIGDDLALIYRDAFTRILESGKGEDLEYSLPMPGGEHWFLCRATPVILPDGTWKSVSVLARDITDRKKIENSLTLFRTLIDRSNDAIEVVDPVTLRYLDLNQRACSEVGYTREEMLSMTVYDIDPELTPIEYGEMSQHLTRSRSLIKERLHRRKDGSVFHVEVNTSLINVGANYLVAIVRDITDRKAAENALRQLSGHLLRTQDEERRSVAREVHDGVGSHISGLSLALGGLRRFLDESNPEHVRAISNCRELIQTAGAEIRAISYLLHPPTLEQLGLQAALTQLARGLSERGTMKISTNFVANLGRLQWEVELTLFRVAQEALNNVLRHSESKTVEVSISRRAGHIVLRVIDDGKGMPKNSDGHTSRLGVGISGMQERLRNLGGTFSIKSSKTRGGCIVEARVAERIIEGEVTT
jgi:PAS domain S-box-containing protein